MRAVVDYEPPLSDPVIIQGKAWHISAMPLAKGVLGCAYANSDEIWIPLIVAEKKGSGDVGRFLDSLSARCVVVDVVSPRLKEMLVRRGWKQSVGTEHECWRKMVSKKEIANLSPDI
jgi:hypothetical protein